MAAGEYYLAGRELESPFFNAAGLINHPDIEVMKREARRLAATGVGAIQYGSITIPKSLGNEHKFGAPTDYYDRQTGRMANAKGLPNPGREEVLANIDELVDIAHKNQKLAIISVSPTVYDMDSVEQAVHLAEDFLETKADFVEINVACPNIVTDGDGRKPIMGYDPEIMQRLINELDKRIGRSFRLILKTANHLTPEQKRIVPDLGRLLIASQVFVAVEVPNTEPGYVLPGPDGRPALSVPGGAGGLSGPVTRQNGREQLELWDDEIGGFIDIISTQGINSGHELAWRLGHGAVAGSSVSMFWNATESWGSLVDRTLGELAQNL